MYKTALSVCLLIIVMCACRSNERVKRGWIGGTAELQDHPTRSGEFVHVPAAVLRDVPDNSPAAHAGLRPSDAVLRIDGVVVDDPVHYRELIERKRPGETVQVDVWRCGQCVRVPVVVGEEELCYRNVLHFGIMLAPGVIDLWPFDNGVNVLGIAQAQCRDNRVDLGSPGERYKQCLCEAEARRPELQETVTVGALPLRVVRGKEVLRQGPAPAR